MGKDHATKDTRLFERLDQDGDGYLGDEEVLMSERSGLLGACDRPNVDGDGFLTRQDNDRH